MKRVSRDERLQAIAILLIPGLVGHAIQLVGEDVPWADWARLRYFHTPGWHLLLPPVVPVLLAAGLAVSVIRLAVRRYRPWMLAIVALYAAHYLTYPYRIRNHMSLMLAELAMLAGVWWIGRGHGRREVDAWAVRGMASVLCVTYASAALHKINTNFTSIDPARSAAVEGLTTFWIYGDLGSTPPGWAIAVAIWGTIVIEALAPILAWRVHALRVPLVLVLFAFHFPHVAVMNVADYPMIASAFYPALFPRAHFRLVLRHARRPNAFNVTGAALGVAAQLWFIPWWGALTIFGIGVMALWGWASGAMVRMLVHAAKKSA